MRAPLRGAPSALCVDVASVKTTTAPSVSVIDTRTNSEVTGASQSSTHASTQLYSAQNPAQSARRFPLFANDLAFVPNSTVGYLTANGADAVFRVRVDPQTGALVEVGATTNTFIDLVPGYRAAKAGKNPIGIAIAGLDKNRHRGQ